MIKKSIILLSILTIAASNLSAQEKKAPNILFIFSDDHATAAIGAYGSVINKTPNIDRIADEGAVFQNSFCGNSICQPSRASVLTGKHSHKNGVTYNGAHWDGNQTVFTRLLKEQAGYQTALIGKWHMEPHPSTEFDYWKVLNGSGGQGVYYNPEFMTQNGLETLQGYSTDVITNEAMQWLNQEWDRSKPFSLMVQFKSPHVPRTPPVRYVNLYDNVTIPEPPTLFDNYENRQTFASNAWMHVKESPNIIMNIFPPRGSKLKMDDNVKKWYNRLTEAQKVELHQVYDKKNAEHYRRKKNGDFKDPKVRIAYHYQRNLKEYLGCVAAVDENVGRLLSWLDLNGLAEDTIVIYSSDQSYFLGEHGWMEKRWMYEEGLQMPFIIRWPDVIKPGTRREELIQNIDYAPTFLDIAGLDIPNEMDGMSMLPLLKDHKKKVVKSGKSQTKNYGKKIAWRDTIYYHYYHHGAHNVPRHDGVRNDRFKLIHFYTEQDNVYELYDLKTDPNEVKNVYDNPEYAGVREKMEQELDQQRSGFEVPEEAYKAPYVFNRMKVHRK